MRTLLRDGGNRLGVDRCDVGSVGEATAQTFQGGLRGAVKDAQGVIPGATVTLTNEGTGVSRDTVTNESGEYSFPALDPGTYTVKASVTGFKTFERRASASRRRHS